MPKHPLEQSRVAARPDAHPPVLAPPDPGHAVTGPESGPDPRDGELDQILNALEHSRRHLDAMAKVAADDHRILTAPPSVPPTASPTPTTSMADGRGPTAASEGLLRPPRQARPDEVAALIELDRSVGRASKLALFNILACATAVPMMVGNAAGPFPATAMTGLFIVVTWDGWMSRRGMLRLRVKAAERLAWNQIFMIVAVGIWALGSAIEVLTGAPGQGLMSLAAAPGAAASTGLGPAGDRMMNDMLHSMDGLVKSVMLTTYGLTFVGVLVTNLYFSHRISAAGRSIRRARAQLPLWLLRTIRPECDPYAS